MPETEDPLVALTQKSLAQRAAGARDLGVAGTAEHLPALVKLAVDDPSPGVRLAAAAAAADILSRARLGPRADTLSTADRRARWAEIRVVDPGVNPGIFQVCGTLGVPEAVDRIVGAMRDPRVDVRQGACVGLWRLCASAAVNGDAELEARVVGLLSDTRIKPETHAEIARVASVVGFTSATEPVRRLAETSERQLAVVLADALQRLEWPASLAGVWVDLGLDGGEVNVDAKSGAIVALTGSDALVRADGSRVVKKKLDARVRRLWLKRPGAAEATWAIQLGPTTYWAAEADEVGELGDRIVAAEAFDTFALVDPLLPDTASAARVRGVVRLRAGDLPGALAYLSAASEMKKVPTDTWWFLADVLHALGRDEEARPHLEKYLSKAGKRAPWVAEAKKRLGE